MQRGWWPVQQGISTRFGDFSAARRAGAPLAGAATAVHAQRGGAKGPVVQLALTMGGAAYEGSARWAGRGWIAGPRIRRAGVGPKQSCP